MSNDLIHEVEESLKQERMEKLWKEYGSYVIAACVLAVLFTAAISGWRTYNVKANTADTAAVLYALDQENKAQAVSTMLETEDLRGGQEAVARLTAAGLLIREDKPAEALTHYRAVAANGDVPEMFRELARYLAVRTAWTLDSDGDKAQVLLDELSPVIANEGSSWKYHARVLAAMINAADLQNYQAARDMLVPVREEKNLPLSLIQTARALDQVYQEQLRKVEGSAPVATAAVEEPEG